MFHVVDDDKHVREFLAEFITLLGFKVDSFSCPIQYLDYMRSTDFARPMCLITDIQMPKMNGYQMIEEIREQHPDLRIVAMSGYSEEREKGNNICQFIGKPFSPEDLEKMISAIAECNEFMPAAKKR